MSTPANLARACVTAPAVTRIERTAAHSHGAQASRLKLEMSARLRRIRDERGIDQCDVHDRQQLVSEWENGERPHAPNLLHIIAAGSDPVSRPYAVEALTFAAERIGLDVTERVAVVHASESERGLAVTVEVTDVLRTNATTLADGKLCERDLEQRVRETREAIAALQEQLASDLAQLEALRSTES